jgi:hypothetical protein
MPIQLLEKYDTELQKSGHIWIISVGSISKRTQVVVHLCSPPPPQQQESSKSNMEHPTPKIDLSNVAAGIDRFFSARPSGSGWWRTGAAFVAHPFHPQQPPYPAFPLAVRWLARHPSNMTATHSLSSRHQWFRHHFWNRENSFRSGAQALDRKNVTVQCNERLWKICKSNALYLCHTHLDVNQVDTTWTYWDICPLSRRWMDGKAFIVDCTLKVRMLKWNSLPLPHLHAKTPTYRRQRRNVQKTPTTFL